MSEVILAAQTGRETGTSNSRRLRAADRVPGVLYGGDGPAEKLSFVRKDLRDALTTDAGRNAVIRLQYDGTSVLTMLREVQVHPVRRRVIHIDLVRLDEDAKVEVEVPIELVGDARAVTAEGGLAQQRLTDLQVSVRPSDIPNVVEVDVSDMVMDDVISVADLTLPDGVEVLNDPEFPVVVAEITRAAVSEEDEAAEGEDGEEGEGADGDDAEGSADDDASGGDDQE